MKFFILFLLCAFAQCLAYTWKPSNSINSKRIGVKVFAASYQELLERNRKSKFSETIAREVQLGTPQVCPAVTNLDGNVITKESNRNLTQESIPQRKPPFSDELYDHLKYVITKLTARIKSDTVLSADELTAFQQSVNIILKDAYEHQDNIHLSSFEEVSSKISGRDESIVNPTILTESTNFFDDFKGLNSTWDIPGMEEMTQEQYYSALNERNANIRNERRQREGRYDLQEFMSSLSRRNSHR